MARVMMKNSVRGGARSDAWLCISSQRHVVTKGKNSHLARHLFMLRLLYCSVCVVEIYSLDSQVDARFLCRKFVVQRKNMLEYSHCMKRDSLYYVQFYASK
jgi:hypothetical protein